MQAFSRAAAKPEGPSQVDLLEAILRERPDLHGEMVYFPGVSGSKNDGQKNIVPGHFQGGNAYIIFIGNEVFKAASFGSAEYFDKEWQTLCQMEGKGLPVPEVTCVGKEAVFFGMTRLPGVQLSKDFLDVFKPEEIELLAHDLGDFIAGMAKALPRDERDQPAVYFDLQPKNILIDPETRKMTGVVDFGIINHSSNPSGLRIYGRDVSGFNALLCRHAGVREAFGMGSLPAEVKSTRSPSF